MRVAIVLDRFDSRLGGLEHWASQFARWLAGRSHDVHIVASRCAREGAPPEVTLHEADPASSPLARAASLTACARRLGAVVHDLGSGCHGDVLHPLFGSRSVAIERQQAALPPLQRWRRALSPAMRRRWSEQRRLERRQFRDGTSPIIAASHMVATHLAQRHGIDRRRLTVIHNGVDVDRFSPERCAPLRADARARLGVPDGTPLFLTIATNPMLKGVPTLVRALARLAGEGTPGHLVVAGAAAPPALTGLAARLAVDSRITWVGHAADPLPLYAAADAFLLCSWYDPCSLTVLEAMACARPSMTTRWNGASELMTHGVDGMVVERPDDVLGVGAAMRTLADAAAASRMGDAARRAALEQRLDLRFGEIERLYVELGRTSRAAGPRGGSPAAGRPHHAS